MPPRQPLPKEVIEDFRQWILMGAPDPRTGSTTTIKSTVTAEDIAKGREFCPSRNLPRPRRQAILRGGPRPTSIALVRSEQVKHGLEPSADADAWTVLRRLSFDLIGLPPSLDEIAEFEAAWRSNAESAIAQAVDSLLARPQFGERWGRHWLDIARYAESSGKEVDMTFPHAWRYRNYVIDSFNQNKPTINFIREQIAGDLLPAKSDQEWAEHLIATGFLALGPKALIEQNPRQFQADLIDEQIDATTRVILGVSVAVLDAMITSSIRSSSRLLRDGGDLSEH